MCHILILLSSKVYYVTIAVISQLLTTCTTWAQKNQFW